MELIGNRWTYPILRELMLGPKRFNELLRTVRGITPAVLTGRLRELCASGLIEMPATSDGPQLYGLTPWGAELRPILQEIGRWAQASPCRESGGGHTPDAAVQAMITMARPIPGTPDGELQLYLHDSRVSNVEHPYRVWWNAAAVEAERGTIPEPVATVACDSSAWTRVLFRGATVDEEATVSGDEAAVAALLSCFPTGTGARNTVMPSP